MPHTSESDLARACTELLELDGWRALKTDPVSDKGRGKGFGEIGMADSLYIRYLATKDEIGFRSLTQTMWIEWKTPLGRAAPHQHAWRERERKRGALALIAGIDFMATFEGFSRWYLQSGLQRKKFWIGGRKPAKESR